MSKEAPSEQVAPKKLVLSLVRRLNETKTRLQSISGELGAEIREAVEDKHLHSGAVKLIAKMARMDPDKRDDFIRAYHLYWTYAKEANLFGSSHVGDLVDGAEAGAHPDPASLGDVAEDNVRKLRRGITQTTEEKTGADDHSAGDGNAEGSYALG